MAPKSHWTDHINLIRQYAEQNHRFPTYAEVKLLLRGLKPITREKYYILRQQIVRSPRFREQNPWYNPDPRKKRGPRDAPVYFPTINEKRLAAGLEPWKKERRNEG